MGYISISEECPKCRALNDTFLRIEILEDVTTVNSAVILKKHTISGYTCSNCMEVVPDNINNHVH